MTSSGQRRADGGAGDLRQNGVEGRALPVAGDEDGNIVLIETGMAGRPTPFSRLAWQIGPTALEGFENEGLIRFDDPAQRSRLVVRWRAEKPMPPAERRRWMDAAEFRGLRQTSCPRSSPGRDPATSPSCADAPSASWSER